MTYPRSSARQRGYTWKWEKLRARFLAEQPLCRMCQDGGLITAATVVDHIKPHLGNHELMWSWANLQSLCARCHNSTKQRIDHGHVPQVVGEDGWPL